jgi:uncharacterized protein YkwD
MKRVTLALVLVTLLLGLRAEASGHYKVSLPLVVSMGPPLDGWTMLLDPEREAVIRINREREALGVAPLAPDSALIAAARRHSNDMAETGTFGHIGSDGSTPSQRMLEAGYGWSRCGETLGVGHLTAEEIVDGWMDSPNHRAILVDGGYVHVGMGLVSGGGRTAAHWTATFGSPSSAP